MNPPRVGVALVAILLAAGGCAKQQPPPPPENATAPLVPAAERSRYFETVASHLELGGTLYGYADVEGDALKAAESLQGVMARVAAMNPALQPKAPIDYRGLATALGLEDIKAMGLSSVRGADGSFRNREFLYTPAGRHGLLAVVGGPPTAFAHTRLAPADADFYCENEIDLPALYATVKDVAARLGHPAPQDSLDVQVKAAGIKLGLSLLDIIGAWHGRVTIVLRADPGGTYAVASPLPIVLPKYSGLVCIDGIGAVLEGDLAKSAALTETVEGTRHFFTPKRPGVVEGLEPVLVVDGSALYIATSAAFLRESLDRTTGLEQNPDFQRLLAVLGPDGNGVSYVTPRFFSQLRELTPLNAQGLPLLKGAFSGILQVPVPEHPLMAVRENLPDGILIRSSFNRSLKKDLALLAIYNPVTIGLGAALIGLQRTQAAPPPRPPLPRPGPMGAQRGIPANLRVLWTLANRYYRLNQVDTATFDDLVGPGKVLPRINVWAGEDYRAIVFEKGKPISVRTSDGRIFTYPASPVRAVRVPPPVPAN
jgi:hypothetical protein